MAKRTPTELHRLPVIPQITPTINRNFSSIKNSSHREKIFYICGLRARIECEPFSEHSTRSDRVTNIGYFLPVGASVLLTQLTIYLAVAVVASEAASVVEASLAAAVVSVDVSVAVESALFKDTCAQSFWSTSLL